MAHEFDTEQHKARLRTYFDGVGFERWRAIYGEGKLSSIRQTVRQGHEQMLGYVRQWLGEAALPPDADLFDAGCGTGLFSLAMARQGFQVTAVDIAPQMVETARQQAQAAGLADRIQFVVGDLATVSGSYAAVACLDVLIHYPPPAFAPLCQQLARLSRGPLLITYAPYNRLLAALHWIGGRFPQSQRRTTIAMVTDQFVQQTLAAVDMRIVRSVRISCGFYHVALIEAQPNHA